MDRKNHPVESSNKNPESFVISCHVILCPILYLTWQVNPKILESFLSCILHLQDLIYLGVILTNLIFVLFPNLVEGWAEYKGRNNIKMEKEWSLHELLRFQGCFVSVFWKLSYLGYVDHSLTYYILLTMEWSILFGVVSSLLHRGSP